MEHCTTVPLHSRCDRRCALYAICSSIPCQHAGHTCSGPCLRMRLWTSPGHGHLRPRVWRPVCACACPPASPMHAPNSRQTDPSACPYCAEVGILSEGCASSWAGAHRWLTCAVRILHRAARDSEEPQRLQRWHLLTRVIMHVSTASGMMPSHACRHCRPLPGAPLSPTPYVVKFHSTACVAGALGSTDVCYNVLASGTIEGQE